MFIGILGESFEIQFLAIFNIDFNKGCNQIWNRIIFIINIGMLGESFEFQFLAILYIYIF